MHDERARLGQNRTTGRNDFAAVRGGRHTGVDFAQTDMIVQLAWNFMHSKDVTSPTQGLRPEATGVWAGRGPHGCLTDHRSLNPGFISGARALPMLGAFAHAKKDTPHA